MTTEILGRDLAERRRSLFAYTAGMAAYVLVVVAIYPAFKDSTSLDSFASSNAGLAAVFGVSGSLTSSAGWLSANVYANFFPLVLLLLSVGYGAACIAGQEESGLLELTLSLPFRRTTVVAEKIGALAVQVAVLSVVVFLTSWCGTFFQMDLSVSRLAMTTAATGLMAVDFGLLALALGAVTGNRGLSIGIATVVAAASYLVSSLAPVVSAIEPFRILSLFYWSVGDNQLSSGTSAASYGVLVGVGALTAVAGLILFERHDLRA